MIDESGRVQQLERKLRLAAGIAVLALAAAVIALFRGPATGPAAAGGTAVELAGGASLEMVGQDLRITLPSASSSVVLQTPAGEEIARFGSPGPRQLGE